MSKELFVSSTPHETKVAVVEDDQLAEIYFERENEYTLAGSVYKGRVTRVLPGMQSAFVDIGLERDAFLYVTDFLEEQDSEEDIETTPAPQQQQRGERRAPLATSLVLPLDISRLFCRVNPSPNLPVRRSRGLLRRKMRIRQQHPMYMRPEQKKVAMRDHQKLERLSGNNNRAGEATIVAIAVDLAAMKPGMMKVASSVSAVIPHHNRTDHPRDISPSSFPV